MTNTIFLLLNIFFLQPSLNDSTVSVYDLQINSIDSTVINLADYQNKHLFVAEFDASNPDREELVWLDSLYRSDTEHISVIAIPALDFNSSVNITDLKSMLRDTLGLGITITDTGYVKKDAALNQHPLMKWISYRNENGHVNNDVIEAGQFYMIGTTGILYGSLVKQSIYNNDLVNFLMNNEPSE